MPALASSPRLIARGEAASTSPLSERPAASTSAGADKSWAAGTTFRQREWEWGWCASVASVDAKREPFHQT